MPEAVYPAFSAYTTLLGDGSAAGSLSVALGYDEATKEQTCNAFADYAMSMMDPTMGQMIQDECAMMDGNAAAVKFVSNNDGSMNGWCVSVWTADMVEDSAWCLTDADDTMWISTIANVEGEFVEMPEKFGDRTYDVLPNGAYASYLHKTMGRVVAGTWLKAHYAINVEFGIGTWKESGEMIQLTGAATLLAAASIISAIIAF